MSIGSNPFAGAEPLGHLVQLYGEDKQLLAENVGQYLRVGLRRGDGLLVIATAEHSYAFARQLRDDPAYQPAIRQGRLVFLDAEITLSRFMIDGVPDWVRFEQVATDVLRRLRERAGSASVRAYGEMVGLLWKAGHVDAAIRLEEYWNKLLAAHGFDLFCAYPIDILADEPHSEAMHALLCTHTHLLPDNGALEQALDRALEEVLGATDEALPAVQADGDQHRPVMPRAEAAVLWLKAHRPTYADRVLDRARQYRHVAHASPAREAEV